MCGPVGCGQVRPPVDTSSFANSDIVNQALETAKAGDLKGAIDLINQSDLSDAEKNQAIQDLFAALMAGPAATGNSAGETTGGGCGGAGGAGGGSGGGCGGAGAAKGNSFYALMQELIEALKSGDPKKIEEAKKNLKTELTSSGLTGEQADQVISSIDASTPTGSGGLAASSIVMN